MPRLLALEWDAREARVAVARTRGSEATLEQAFAIPFPQRDEGSSAANIGNEIQSALMARGLTRIDTLVAVGRTSIELRVLTLPPAPPEELPDLVRFQSTKQFTTAAENWPLDFVPLAQEAESQTVLAAAISPDLVGQIRQTCATAHLEPQRLVLRPFAAASLLRRRGQDSRCTLMVDPLTDEADLTVLVDGQVGFVRTVRLPVATDNDEFSRALSGEIRRTIGAASNQLRGQRVERIVICGTTSDHSALQAQLTQQTSLEVTCFDPLGAIPLASEMQSTLPVRGGRFAPLIGMLMDEAANEPHGIDFLNPRKRPEPVNHRRRNLLLGAVAAAIVLLLAYWQYRQFDDLGLEIADLKKQSLELDKTLKQLQPTLMEVEKVDEFTAGDVNWLDELHLISERFLPSEESIATELNFNSQQQGGGQMLVEGYVKQAALIDALERKLRDEKHKVSAPGKSFDERSESFPWRFKETVVVDPEDPEDRFFQKGDAKAAPQPQSPTKNESTPPSAEKSTTKAAGGAE